MYKQEALLLKTKADKLEADGEDEYEVRQQVRAVRLGARLSSGVEVGADEMDGQKQRRVEADSVQMIPDSEQRLAKALEELEDLIVRSPLLPCALERRVVN